MAHLRRGFIPRHVLRRWAQLVWFVTLISEPPIHLRHVAAGVAGLVFLTSLASAQSTWSGGSGTAWNDAGNWDVLPATGSNLIFNSFTGSQPSNNDFVGESFGSLTFGTMMPAAGVTLGGNPFTLTGGLVNNNATAGRTVNINNNLVIGAVQSWSTASSSNAVTFINGDLSGTDILVISAANTSAGTTPPNIRLTGINAGFTGDLFANTSSLGLLLGSPASMTGGLINLNGANGNLWLTGPATYTF